MIKLNKFPIYSEPFLRQQCTTILTAEEAHTVKEALYESFPTSGALAVAAPQIGIQKRAFLALLPPKRRGETSQWLFCCNPKILDKYDTLIFPNEGCLSFPRKNKNTKRYEYVKVQYFDEDLKEHNLVAEQLEAVIFQHEIDHLNGILYLDHAVNNTIRNTISIGRNDACPCGSKKKYKKCCLK